MALPVIPNTCNFMGVALVINRSRDGPRFVFHYPARRQRSKGPCEKPDDGDDVDEDDILMQRRSSHDDFGFGFDATGSSILHAEKMAQWNYEDHLFLDSGTQLVPWERVAGYPTKDLENILTPNRAYHKKLFQVSLDNIYAVSYPIYVPENGVWKKKKKKKQEEERQVDSTSALKDDEQSTLLEPDAGVRISEATPLEGQPQEDKEEKKASMTMFNLVFFLRPKKHEVKDLVDIMFTHIIKKINKAYKFCQERSDFVWKESKRILALKDKGREEKRKMSLLWEEILQTSSLAASMQEIYEAVSHNRIAALQLETAEGTVTHSVQIPLPFHISDLPQDGEESHRGLWMTTANTLASDEASEDPGFLDKNFALLLMTDEKRIIAELQTDPDETTQAMIEFVRHCKPNLSFYQVAQQTSNLLTPEQVRRFAQHFIFWRRAIAIPPLHPRDMYIVSPNCDTRRLPQASMQWARQFPLSPSLPNFLAELSVAPRPYKLYCPIKLYRPNYMLMLAWLMRGGWVTQLCTFAYVIVWPEIIYEVEHALEAEQIARARRAQERGREPGSIESDDAATVIGSALGDAAVSSFVPPLLDDSATVTAFSSTPDFSASTSSNPLPHSNPSSNPFFGGENLPLSHSQSLASIRSAGNNFPSTPAPASYLIHQHPLLLSSSNSFSSPDIHNLPSSSSPNNFPSHSTSIPAEQIAEKARLERIASKQARELAESATAHARKTPPQRTAHPSINNARHLEGISPYIILDAKKATGKESLYLEAIRKRFELKAAESRKARQNNLEQGGSPAGDARTTASTTTTTAPGPGTRHHHQHASRFGLYGSNLPGAGGVSSNGKDTSSPDWDERVAKTWPVFGKYFNGRSALERIALQEDMKRKDVWNLLTAMSEYLLCVRHW
ncbi:nitrogen permease regulator 3 [Cladorrhinum sp. PSN259]|nr:nitrogen permease regulator 3 [Cladorrhinum sp. PSN259]